MVCKFADPPAFRVLFLGYVSDGYDLFLLG
jgi:hypothetical protein